MKRQHSFLAAFALLLSSTAGIPAATAAPQPQSAPQQDDDSVKVDPSKLITGKWVTTLSGKQYLLHLSLSEDGDLVGTVTLPDKKQVKVENGILVVDEFSFSTMENEVEWEWTGTVAEGRLQGERERFDPDAHESFTAKRNP